MPDSPTIVIMGRLASNPILRRNRTKAGSFMLIGLISPAKEQGRCHDEMALIRCMVFGELAEALVGHQKGETVKVSGRLEVRPNTRETAEQPKLILVCETIQFIGT